MLIEKVDINSISSDPANARKHSPRNLEVIQGSLRRFGQQKPIVVDDNNVVRAGNGTLAAAKALGWKQINIVRSQLPLTELTAYAIADNRTAELAEWDNAVLTEMLNDPTLGDVGFSVNEIETLLNKSPEPLSAASEIPAEKWMVIVTCKDEADQVAFLEQMNAAGRDCRALMA
jgi:ParB-like chromosome segregation protein Spo0J